VSGEGGVVNHVGLPFGNTREGWGDVGSGPIGGKKRNEMGGGKYSWEENGKGRAGKVMDRKKNETEMWKIRAEVGKERKIVIF